MLGDEIAIHLAGSGLGLVLGSTDSNGVFGIPFPPQAADSAVCVIEYPGRENVEGFGPSGTPAIFERPRFQVVCRDTQDNAETCRRMAQSTWKALRHTAGTLSGVTYGFIKTLAPPAFLKFDESQRIYYAYNAEAHKAEST